MAAQKTPSKKHHYVPEFMLKGFSSNKRHIWVYDKANDRSFSANIEDVGCEKFFNTVPPNTDIATKGIKKDFIESYMSNIDDDLAKYLKNFIEKLDLLAAKNPNGFPKYKITNYEELCDLSLIAVYQTLRTREVRESIAQMHLNFSNAIEDITKDIPEDDPFVKSYRSRLTLDDQVDKLLHFDMLTDEKTLATTLANCLEKHLVIGVNTSAIPLVCTDNPVAMTNNHGRRILAWGAKGVEIALPLNEKYILLWTCRSPFGRFTKFFLNFFYDKKTFKLTDQMVSYYNSLAFKCSTQYIYSSQDNFDFFKEIGSTVSPGEKSPFRARWAGNAFGKEISLPINYRKKTKT